MSRSQTVKFIEQHKSQKQYSQQIGRLYLYYTILYSLRAHRRVEFLFFWSNRQLDKLIAETTRIRGTMISCQWNLCQNRTSVPRQGRGDTVVTISRHPGTYHPGVREENSGGVRVSGTTDTQRRMWSERGVGGDDVPSDTGRPGLCSGRTGVLALGEAQDDLPGGVLCGARCSSSCPGGVQFSTVDRAKIRRPAVITSRIIVVAMSARWRRDERTRCTDCIVLL